MNRIVQGKLAKDKLQEKMNDEAYRKPSNCQNLTVPKIKPEMWDRIKPGARSNDIRAQRLQQMLQKATVPVIQMYEDSRKNHDKAKGTVRGHPDPLWLNMLLMCWPCLLI